MTSRGLLTMSQKEFSRVEVIARTCKKELKQSQAANRLAISVRQAKRLCRCYRKEGAGGLISKQRGKQSNHALPKKTKAKIIELAKKHYSDFGPTFMSEKLLEKHHLKISKESLRQLLMTAGIWKAKRQQGLKLHPQRERRACRGELVQIDGSPHDWFEGRAPKCCLIVFIDDATSEVLSLRFEPVETTQAYFRGLYQVVQTYGIPLSLYSDKHGIFRVNQSEAPEAQTQFGRACEQLGIELINAHSAPAKGRVERSNQTHQDRLVKELRLAHISDIDTANVFLENYRHQHNERFARLPREPQDAFIANKFSQESLLSIFSEQETRKATKNLELSFQNKIYQIQKAGQGRRLQQANITLCRTMHNEIRMFYRGKPLEYKIFEPNQKRPLIVDDKALNALCDKKLKNKKEAVVRLCKPKASHPWRHLRFSSKAPLLHEQHIT